MQKEVRISKKIVPSFYDAWRIYDDLKITNVFEKGGRGSSKSTTISCKMVMNRMTTLTHGLCCRKFKNTLRKSVRNQIIWSIYHLEVQSSWYWSDTESGDMTITYKPTGTKIFFEGADGEKIKGWKTPKMPTVDIWFEEITEFKTEEELSSIKLSIMREILSDGYKYTFFHSYNPPKRKHNWINKTCESVIIPPNTYIHHSTFLDNPFLPQQWIDEAEHIKSSNKRRYNWEYLGEPIGSGVVPFDNLTFRTITDAEFNSFDNIRQGSDWGYAVDPLAFVRWHYDKTRRIIYGMNEIYGIKISNREFNDKLKLNSYNNTMTVADSAEPKSISEMNSYGSRFIGAKKGQGSVEFGEKWLDDLEEIIIDPQRTPNIAREFESIDYMVDKDGNIKSKLEDKDNHTIDATRYCFENDMKTTKWGW